MSKLKIKKRNIKSSNFVGLLVPFVGSIKYISNFQFLIPKLLNAIFQEKHLLKNEHS